MDEYDGSRDESPDFTSAFENAPIGMALISPESRPLRFNRAFCKMLGYTPAAMMGLSLRDVTHPEDVKRDLHERQLCLAGVKCGYQHEKRYFHRDGHIVWGHLTCTLVRDAAGAPEHFIAQVVDVTERRLAQQQLHDMQAILHMAAQVGRLGGFAAERGSDRVIWSPEICAMFDVKPGFAPTRAQSLGFFATSDREAMRERLRRCARDGSPFDAEAQVVTAKGRLLWVRVIGEAEWDAQGVVQRIHGACQDITDAKRAEEQSQREIRRLNAELEERVRQRTSELESANRELEAFSYSLAHDLRAPLGSIDGFSRMLEEGSDPARRAHCVSRIRAGVRQMGELTDGLLALANLARAEMRDDEVDLAELARAAVSQLRERAPQRCVEVDIARTLPARGDARLLSQVMGNLVGNAWKFTSRKDDARIEVGSCADGAGGTVYYVRDNGAGFDMAYAHRMFEAFQRMHSAGEFEGTGIGLAIVHRIVTRHGGRIWAEGAPQQGATFRFTLPA